MTLENCVKNIKVEMKEKGFEYIKCDEKRHIYYFKKDKDTAEVTIIRPGCTSTLHVEKK